jgi:hypothetical protein
MLKFNHHCQHPWLASGPVLAFFGQRVPDIGTPCQRGRTPSPVPHSSPFGTHNPRTSYLERPPCIRRPGRQGERNELPPYYLRRSVLDQARKVCRYLFRYRRCNETPFRPRQATLRDMGLGLRHRPSVSGSLVCAAPDATEGSPVILCCIMWLLWPCKASYRYLSSAGH